MLNANFLCANNLDLYCIDVDDSVWSANNWTNIDPQHTFSTNCPGGYGCTDPSASNYDPTATCDDGSCLTNYGCIDSTALNYDPSANCDDGSCTYCVYGCMDTTQFN